MGILASCSQQKRSLKWHNAPGHRWSKINPGNGKTGFKKLDPERAGIDFKNHLPDSLIVKNRILLDGSGVATGDINGDGRIDIYFCQLDGPNKLYENMGDMHFKDITDSAGVAQKGYYSTGAVFVDVDGDADLDLLVTSLDKKNNLYLNNGKGHFTLDKNSGLGSSRGATSIALADIDGDGDLDLYITNYRRKSARDVFNPKQLSWQNTVVKVGNTYKLKPQFKPYYTLLPQKKGRPARRKIGRVDELYLNQGGVGPNWGGFKEIKDLDAHFLSAEGKPLGLKPDWGLTAKFHDINNDGLPDLYICNDYWTPDRVWINQGRGVFKALGEKNIRDFSYSAMSVAFSDINNDGLSDIFVSEMLSPIHQRQLRQSGSEAFSSGPGSFLERPQYNQNSLYLNRGDTTFAETANYSGLAASGWSWASKFMDIDLDGYQDLIVNTGNWFDLLDMDTQYHTRQEIIKGSVENQRYLFEYPSLKLVNKIYRNNGDLTFTDQSEKWGFHNKDVSQGMATADLDNDGDLDIINNRLKQQASIYENTVPAPRIEVRLKGLPPNTQAVGAKLTLTGGAKAQQRQVTSGGGYESGSAPIQMFAANGSGSFYHLSIRWPSGVKTKMDSLKANRIYEIDEPKLANGKVKVEASKTAAKESNAIFKDVSQKISYTHHEDVYPDFKIQPLLPERLSQEGPGVAWIDYNQDGNQDLWIASGKGGTTGILKNNGNGTFRQVTLPDVSDTAPGDQTSIVGWATQKSTYVIIGSANFEQKTARVPSAYIYRITATGNISRKSIPGAPSTTGPLAVTDYDGDGDVDIFIGGRFLPYFYPANASSRLYKNDNGYFVPDRKNAKTFRKIGMVTASVFSDIDGDGDPDLILATEWGPIKIFRNDNGIFHNVTTKWGMNKFYGWWKGLAVGDFNNDGRMDIVATNLGTNNSYKLYKNHPLKMYYDDFNGDHHLDIIESHYDSTLNGYVPRRRAYAFNSEVPSVVQNVKNNTQYAHSTLYDLLRDNLKMTDYKKINTLKSMVFINEGSSFKAHPLPPKAQLSTAFDVGVGDINNDGNEDLFLSQNFFALPAQTPRMDAGRGLLLEGNGKGHFKAVSGHKSGIKIYGEQRGAALSDFNKDGRIDLAVSQNDARAKLYLNQTPNRGYRIRLSGPDANKNGIGSSIRLVYQDGSKGPRREIQAGSGYWSQNSVVQIMGAAQKVAKIEVDWFDGSKQFVDASPGKKNYIITYK